LKVAPHFVKLLFAEGYRNLSPPTYGCAHIAMVNKVFTTGNGALFHLPGATDGMPSSSGRHWSEKLLCSSQNSWFQRSWSIFLPRNDEVATYFGHSRCGV